MVFFVFTMLFPSNGMSTVHFLISIDVFFNKQYQTTQFTKSYFAREESRHNSIANQSIQGI